jgi:hypothetical protein
VIEALFSSKVRYTFAEMYVALAVTWQSQFETQIPIKIYLLSLELRGAACNDPDADEELGWRGYRIIGEDAAGLRGTRLRSRLGYDLQTDIGLGWLWG